MKIERRVHVFFTKEEQDFINTAYVFFKNIRRDMEDDGIKNDCSTVYDWIDNTCCTLSELLDNADRLED